MSARCGPGCGHCGRCTAAWEAPSTDLPCDQCGLACDEGDVLERGPHRFCSEACGDAYEADFADWMARRGYMTGEHGTR